MGTALPNTSVSAPGSHSFGRLRNFIRMAVLMPSPKAMHSRLESDEMNATVLADDDEIARLMMS